MLTVKKIFNFLLEKPETSNIELDRVHQALGPRNIDSTKPRDMICRVHFYREKEEIMRKAREKGQVNLNGTSVYLLHDLCRFTL